MRELWTELGASMRILRISSGVSLRQVELRSGVGRGTLSQIETGKARPNRDTVEWYDRELHGDGALLSIYAEARGAHGPVGTARRQSRTVLPGDGVAWSDAGVPFGELVVPGSRHTASWTLHNTGGVRWNGRRLRRVGAHGAVRLIASPPWTPVPDQGPGESARLEIEFRVPVGGGTYAAYWHMVDERERPCFEAGTLLAVLVVAGD